MPFCVSVTPKGNSYISVTDILLVIMSLNLLVCSKIRIGIHLLTAGDEKEGREPG